MMDTFLDFMIGPFRSVSSFYFENQLIFNSLLIGSVLVRIATKRKGKTAGQE
ncbi:hypothetical protein [Oceanobacillus kapialis]|uniref:hypothetical protein n=1 Tax=Oceanobacillus kapialis TaxID=481353 RepID=UPI00384D27E7